MANTIKIKRSSVEGRAPTDDHTITGTPTIAQGELAINTFDQKMYSSDGSLVFEIGAQELLPAMSKFSFTAVSGQTEFTGADENSNTLSVEVGSEMVSLNGVILEPSTDYSVTASAITLLIESEVGDELNVFSFNRISSTELEADLNSKLPISGGQLTGPLTISDGDYISFRDLGDSSTLYTADYILEQGGNDFTIYAADLNLQAFGLGSSTYLKGVDSTGEVSLYNGTDVRLKTTSTGIDVLGTVAATSFTGDGSALTGIVTDLSSYATISHVASELASLVDSAPATLNTLNELAAALGDDANHVTTMTTLIGGKLPLTGGTIGGTLYVEQSNADVASFRRTNNSGDGQIRLGNSDGYVRLGGSNGDFSIKNSGNTATRLQITSAGNVGIGTSSPSAKLDVNGNMAVSGGLTVNGANENISLTAGGTSTNRCNITMYNGSGITLFGGTSTVPGEIRLKVDPSKKVVIEGVLDTENINVFGNIWTNGTVDSRDIGTDGSVLDSIDGRGVTIQTEASGTPTGGSNGDVVYQY